MKKESIATQGINKVLVIVGPSGVGKDTLMKMIFDKYPNSFQKAVTHTTRAMREGEAEGVNYYYVTKEEFTKLKEENGFVETNEYNDNFYGTSRKELEKAKNLDKVMYLIIDINGANSIFNLQIEANYITFLPPSVDALVERLKGRGSENEETINNRINIAKEELEKINNANFWNYKVVNDDKDKAFEELEKNLKELYPGLIA